MAEYFGGTVPWVKSGELRETIITQTEEYLTTAGLENSAAKLLPANTLLVALYGATVGRIGVLGIEAATNQAVCHIIPKKDAADVRYLFYALRSKVPYWLDKRVGGGQPNISQGVIKDTVVPLPPLAEQKRIAGILDAADALRTKRREALAQLDTLLQATFLDLFGDPVTNPKGWEETKVDDICALVRGSSPRPQGDPRFFGGPVPRLMVADITRDGFWVTPRIDSLTTEGAKRSRPVPAGTIVMAVSGDVGVVARVQIPCCVHDGFVAFLDLNETIFRPVFLMFQFHLLKVTHERRKAGAIFQNLTTTDIKAMRLPTPCIEMQNRFEEMLKAHEQQRSNQLKHLAELDTLFASLQSRAFKGEL